MTDSRVAAAVSHWAPRFVANGVDYNDFRSVTAEIDSWDAWCQQWSLAGARHEQLGRIGCIGDASADNAYNISIG